MKRFFILGLVVIIGGLGMYGVSALTGEDSFFLPPAIVISSEAAGTETAAEANKVAANLVKISFSHNKTFYDTSINVELTSKDPKAVIYYSLDGSDPSEKSTKYKGAITINSGNTVKATTIKAIAIKGSIRSDITVKSYVTGKDVFKRFDSSTLLFVLSTDPKNLYDYYYGVSIEGFLRDEYIKSDEYKGGTIDPPAPANFNIRGIESEREFYVEVYDSTGKQLIDQAAGARISGGWSRATSQKSWRLIARNSYSDGNGMFKYNFFSDATDSFGMPIIKYDRLTLRNGGNDRDQAGLRDELTQELARQAGFLDTQSARPAAVFLNGEYYGFSWLKEAYCEGYLEQTYGGVKENYQIIENVESGGEGTGFALRDYQYMYSIAQKAAESDDPKKNFNNEKIFSEFCSLVDIDNLILYYVIEAYIDNKDWPNNNFKAWKYYASANETINNPYNDGKWRFLMFDVEFAWGLYGNGYNANTIKNLISGNNHMGGASVIMKALFQREDMRERYANTMCDLISGTFSYGNVLTTVNKLAKESEKEFNYALKNGYTSSWANAWTVESNRNQIIEFAQKRGNIMYGAMRTVFNVPLDAKMYKITLVNADGADVWLNSRQLAAETKSAETSYFDCYGVDIKADLYSGYAFDCWEVNGVVHTERKLKVDSSMADKDNKIKVVLKTKKLIGEESLYIKELYTSSDSDWVKIYNPNSVSVSTKDYYLSDDETMLNRWKIPTVTIKPESFLIITMKNNKSAESLKKLQTNFSLKLGETLYLSDSNKKIISTAKVTDMLETQSLNRLSNGNYKVGKVSKIS